MKSSPNDYTPLNIDFVRSCFPALKQDFTFMDNAGGSQTLQGVVDGLVEFLTNYDVQLGASYAVSAQAGEKLRWATAQIADLINAERPEEAIIGPSTTLLLRILSLCISQEWHAGDEVIVTNSDHEANVSCWTDLAKRGIIIKIWEVNPDTLEFDIQDLRNLLSHKTKLVAMVHASNILGTINPIKEIGEVVHSAGALFCVDGVAFAPHRLVDVQDFGVDFYVFSFYKVYGPHCAVLYGRYELLRELEGINHYFIGKEEVPYKFQPGNYNYELTYSLTGITEYFQQLHDMHYPKTIVVPNKVKYAKTFDVIAKHEEVLATRLLTYLNSQEAITIIGHTTGDRNKRVPTISFIHADYQSPTLVSQVDKHKIGIRFGDFYAKKLIHDLGLLAKDGVVRVSLVHYNTVEEVDALIGVFEEIF